jgi:exodeoxyribonuclease V alpha subunit
MRAGAEGTPAGRQGAQPRPVEPAALELAGTVDRVLFERERDGFAILRLRPADGGEPLVLVGELAGIGAGEAIRVSGRLEDDPSWGLRLRVERYEPLLPTSAEAIAGWLGSGVVPRLGRKLAQRLLRQFGADLPQVLSQSPQRLTSVRGIGAATAMRIAALWKRQAAERDLLVALQTAGIGPARARRLLAALGEDAAVRLAADPYRVAREVPGVGFRTADRLARAFGLAADAEVRIAAAFEHRLREAAEGGDSAVPLRRAIEHVAALLALDPHKVEAGLAAAVASGLVVRRQVGETEWLLLPDLDRAEAALAVDVPRLSAGPLPWRRQNADDVSKAVRDRLGLALSAGQARALDVLLAHKVAILTGGPGTGKTTLVRALLALLEDCGLNIVLAAPTGRAARRLTETTGHPAWTLHRLLEADPGHGFRRGRSRPLTADLLVIDESSMLDLPLAHATLAALRDRAALLLVGDADQLPPVGPGQVFADLVASGRLPVVELDEVFRQAAGSSIIAAAHRIRRGLPPGFDHEGSSDCFGVRIHSIADAQAKLVELVTRRIPERFGFDPRREIQVLVPTNRGPLGTRELNELLQRALDPPDAPALEHHGYRFTVGGRVMQTENDSERDVSNGDIGIVTALDRGRRSLVVDMDGRQVVYAPEDLDRLVPAWAVTVHKAQGSEYPAVVLVLARAHGRMLRRRLLYTAVTRAKRLLVLLTEPAALNRAVATAEPPRASLLRPRLLGELDEGP